MKSSPETEGLNYGFTLGAAVLQSGNLHCTDALMCSSEGPHTHPGGGKENMKMAKKPGFQHSCEGGEALKEL